MKKAIGLVCLCFFITLIACSQEQKTIKVTGQFKGMEEAFLILTKSDGSTHQKITLDENGSFEIIDTLKQEGVVMCTLLHMNFVQQFSGGAAMGRILNFAAQNGDIIRIEASNEDFEWAQVSGNQYNDYLNQYRKLVKDNKIKRDKIKNKVRELVKTGADEKQIDKQKNKIKALNKKNNDLILDFVKENPQHIMNAYILSREAPAMNYTTLKNGYESLGKKAKESEFGKKLYKRIVTQKNAEASVEGKMAPDFEKVDENGKLIRLSDFRGKKYVLLDFWGSWCGACRASHPHLKDLYKEYKDKGLEIIGIADENNSRNGREKWLKAIEKDGIPWIQILNDEGIEKTDVVELYGVTSFPTKILIDKEGKIIVKETGTRASGSAKDKMGRGTASSAGSASASSAGSSSAGAARSASASSSGSASVANMKVIQQGSGSATMSLGNPGTLPKKKSSESKLDAKLEEIFKK